MDYLISIENNPYHHWQASLLIQSFRRLGLEDRLCIAVAENDSSDPTGLAKNLLSHPRKFVHENYGRSTGVPVINKFAAVLTALENKLVTQPFALLHPDMILNKPIVLPEETDVLMQWKDGTEWVAHFEAEAPTKIPVGSVLVFGEQVPKVFFSKALANAYSLMANHGTEKWLERAAWGLTIREFLGSLRFIASNLEASLVQNIDETASVIHYSTGHPPHFHKKFFKYSNNILLHGSDPFSCLLSQNQLPASGLIGSLIEEYRK